MEPLITCEDKGVGNFLTEELSQLYGGPLAFPKPPSDRPYTIVNFVTTLEGLTSFDIPGHAGGGDISAFNKQDTFIMGLLRALVDAVAVGAQTLRTEPNHLWIPSYISPEHAGMYSEVRQKLGKTRPNPINMFVTGSGKILPENSNSWPAVFSASDVESLIITTEHGMQVADEQFRDSQLAKRKMTGAYIVSGNHRKVDLPVAMSHLRKLGIEYLLVEGGASFNGSIIDQELYDEIFITVAPQIIGTFKETPRPLFVEGFSRAPELALWHNLVSLKIYGDYIYKRYSRQNRKPSSPTP
jgi:riboflavin biosynthesis pyrimidine reductase